MVVKNEKTHVTWRYLKGLKNLKENLHRDLEMMVEHKACHATSPYGRMVHFCAIQTSRWVHRLWKKHLDMEAWKTLCQNFDELLQGNDPNYMTKRPILPKLKTGNDNIWGNGMGTVWFHIRLLCWSHAFNLCQDESETDEHCILYQGGNSADNQIKYINTHFNYILNFNYILIWDNIYHFL